MIIILMLVILAGVFAIGTAATLLTKPKRRTKLTEHKGLPVAGYVSQSDAKVDLVNENKLIEERVLRQIEKIKSNPECDPRMAAIAFTGVQEAFMWLNRSVFQPSRIILPEDQ